MRLSLSLFGALLGFLATVSNGGVAISTSNSNLLALPGFLEYGSKGAIHRSLFFTPERDLYRVQLFCVDGSLACWFGRGVGVHVPSPPLDGGVGVCPDRFGLIDWDVALGHGGLILVHGGHGGLKFAGFEFDLKSKSYDVIGVFVSAIMNFDVGDGSVGLTSCHAEGVSAVWVVATGERRIGLRWAISGGGADMSCLEDATLGSFSGGCPSGGSPLD